MRTEVILLALLVILGNTNKPMGKSPPRPYDFSACLKKPIDIAFIIDSSWNVSPRDFILGRAFLHEFVGKFKIGPQNLRMAAVSFSNTVNTDTAFGFDKYNVRREVLIALLKIVYKPGSGRSTNTAMAIEYARKQFFVNPRPFSKQIAVVLTSSTSKDFEETKAEASLLKKQGVEIIAIGVGRGISVNELKAISSKPNLIFNVKSYNDLLHYFYGNLLVRLCNLFERFPRSFVDIY